jgi:hypothetical protein
VSHLLIFPVFAVALDLQILDLASAYTMVSFVSVLGKSRFFQEALLQTVPVLPNPYGQQSASFTDVVPITFAEDTVYAVSCTL